MDKTVGRGNQYLCSLRWCLIFLFQAYNQSAVEAHLFYSPSIADGDVAIHASAYISSAYQNTSLQNTPTSRLPSADEHPLFYVAVYAAIAFGAAGLRILSIIVQYMGGLRASRLLFKQLLVAVVRATMRWHDSTPTGRAHLLLESD